LPGGDRVSARPGAAVAATVRVGWEADIRFPFLSGLAPS
jgi:hypothetical protein